MFTAHLKTQTNKKCQYRWGAPLGGAPPPPHPGGLPNLNRLSTSRSKNQLTDNYEKPPLGPEFRPHNGNETLAPVGVVS